MVVISLDFSSVLVCPRVRLCWVAQALTMWMAPLLSRPVIGTSGRLPINGHHLARQQLGNGLCPGHETVLQLRWVETGEDIAEGVVGWNTVGQFQEALKPGQLAFAEQFDMDPGICAADGGADGDGQDVHQFVLSGAFYSGIVQLSEMIENGYLGCLCHALAVH